MIDATDNLSQTERTLAAPPVPRRTMHSMSSTESIDGISDLLLLLLEEAEGKGLRTLAGTTRLQKLLFLVVQAAEYRGLRELGEVPPIEFRPYRMGPFNPEVYEAVELLAEFDPPLIEVSDPPDRQSALEFDQYLDEVDLDRSEPSATSAPRPTEYRLTPSGRIVAAELSRDQPPKLRQVMARVIGTYGSMGLRQLLRTVYEEYPEYTTRSEIREELGLG